jgi:Mg2+ and Co2+ transporter CorA
VVTLLGPLLAPIVLLASIWGMGASKPASAELHGVAQ